MEYKIEYRNEYKFDILKDILKKINFQSYKRLMFSVLPSLKGGNFPGTIMSKYKGQTKYQVLLPTEMYFGQIHGKIKLIYTVYHDKKIIMIEKLEPEEFFDDVKHLSKINMYKGIPLTSSIEKDMFKINLLNLTGHSEEILSENLDCKRKIIRNNPQTYNNDINKIKYYSNYINDDVLVDIDIARNNDELLLALYEYRKTNNKISLLLDRVINKLETKNLQIEEIDTPAKIRIIHEMLELVNKKPKLYGYYLNKDGYAEITDGYRIYIINTAAELKRFKFIELKKTPINYRKYINKHLNEESYTEILLDIEDIYDFYKKNKYNNELVIYPLQIGCRTVNINIEYLIETIELMGEDISCYIAGATSPIYFKNESMEEAIVLPVKTY